MNILLENFKGSSDDWNGLISRFETCDAQQSWEWGEAEKALGWDIERYLIKDGNDIAGAFSAEIKKKYGLSFSYLPRGPLFRDYEDKGLFENALKAIKDKFSSSIFIKINPYIRYSETAVRTLTENGFRETIRPSLYTDTLVVDLENSEDILWKGVRKQYRPFIRRASEMLKITDSNSEKALSDFTSLHTQMSAAKKLAQVNEGFFQAFLKSMGNSNLIRIRNAYSGDRILAGMVLLCSNNTIVYKWGASSRDGDASKIYAAHFLQWDTMLWAKKEGFRFYDMGGISSDPNDSVNHFKKGFGGTPLTLAGEFDFVNKHLLYLIYHKVMR